MKQQVNARQGSPPTQRQLLQVPETPMKQSANAKRRLWWQLRVAKTLVKQPLKARRSLRWQLRAAKTLVKQPLKARRSLRWQLRAAKTLVKQPASARRTLPPTQRFAVPFIQSFPAADPNARASLQGQVEDTIDTGAPRAPRLVIPRLAGKADSHVHASTMGQHGSTSGEGAL
ncbi:hypothetical protein OE88DRAFT_1297324 [Heliocybe sulcata]|uniref:Uncharacterized protein n=1 Tax=Heliocybe sulcata TaxID=5364 RepID=A0A5C3N6V1_9AGAM|nr:hypothetical protein OE88DRAFT_1297324 [Heliocybe sulcata]